MPVVLPFAVAILLATLLRPVAASLEPAASGPRWPPPLAILLPDRRLRRADRADPAAVHRPADRPRLEPAGGRPKVAYSAGESLAGMDRAEVDRQLENAADRLRERAGGMAGDAVAGASSLRCARQRRARRFLCFFLVKDGRRLWTWLVELAPARAARRSTRAARAPGPR